MKWKAHFKFNVVLSQLFLCVFSIWSNLTNNKWPLFRSVKWVADCRWSQVTRCSTGSCIWQRPWKRWSAAATGFVFVWCLGCQCRLSTSPIRRLDVASKVWHCNVRSLMTFSSHLVLHRVDCWLCCMLQQTSTRFLWGMKFMWPVRYKQLRHAYFLSEHYTASWPTPAAPLTLASSNIPTEFELFVRELKAIFVELCVACWPWPWLDLLLFDLKIPWPATHNTVIHFYYMFKFNFVRTSVLECGITNSNARIILTNRAFCSGILWLLIFQRSRSSASDI